MPRGTVKWFDPEKGYGVIAQDAGEPDADVDSFAVQGCCRARALTTGERVVFDVVRDSQGIRAENVHRAGACS
ncbi:cold-shock protein [Streptomyces sp. NBC_00829]|uniref:cold-shock protein n=1 Tax=Streptomyces sp. NBC_00829 TaxID=2903679 RepID=UPI00386B4ECB|nr:cold shock domain-containing protein [Streptomyces sp. NBC_00829]